MDDVEQLKMLLKKYLEVVVDTHLTASGHTKVEVVIFFDGEEITKSSNYVLKPEQGENMKILKMMQSNTARCPNCGREEVPGWGDCDCYNHSS